MKDGDVLVLENTRFHKGEEKNDPLFAAELAKLGDIYVNDAFSAAHRAHASTEGLANHLPAYAGRAMQKELEALEAALGNPKRPVVAVVGGAKVSSKIDVLLHLVEKVDALVIGGGMANTFLLAKGVAVGKSLAEPDLADTARKIIAAAEQGRARDRAARSTRSSRPSSRRAPRRRPSRIDAGPGRPDDPRRRAEVGRRRQRMDRQGGDAGLERAARRLRDAALRQGDASPPRGTPPSAPRAGKLLSVAGGGDTVAALNQAGVADDFSFISTAGGAFLEWLEGKALPGVEVLRKR